MINYMDKNGLPMLQVSAGSILTAVGRVKARGFADRRRGIPQIDDDRHAVRSAE